MTSASDTPPTYDAEPTIRNGAELKRVLTVAGYSQRELAQRLGCSRSHVNNIANGVTTLTLRVVEGVRFLFGDDLYRLSIIRARQVEVDDYERAEKQRKFDIMEKAYQDEQARLRDEQRRQDAIDAIRKEMEGGEALPHIDPPNATAETVAPLVVHDEELTTAERVHVHATDETVHDTGDVAEGN